MIPILKDDFIYFDNSATTQKPQEVIDAICNYYKNEIFVTKEKRAIGGPIALYVGNFTFPQSPELP